MHGDSRRAGPREASQVSPHVCIFTGNVAWQNVQGNGHGFQEKSDLDFSLKTMIIEVFLV